MFITIILLVCCVYLTIRGIRTVENGRSLRDDLEKYEFENRNSAGILEFATFEEAKEHEHKRQTAATMIRGGFLMGLFFGVVSACIGGLGF